MITIEQLLESVDLDFEPRWITKDKDGLITLYKTKPETGKTRWVFGRFDEYQFFGKLKLAEFKNKPWSECIYEVPRKTTRKIELLTSDGGSHSDHYDFMLKINELVVAVNELKEVKNE